MSRRSAPLRPLKTIPLKTFPLKTFPLKTFPLKTSVWIVAALFAASCSRPVTLGPEEAVEVMVLDGVGRGRAECVVASLDGQLELAKITGLDVSLTDAELALLATTSSRCAPTIAGTTGVMTGAQGLDESYAAQEAALSNGDIDIDEAVFQMVTDGLEADIGQCLVLELSALIDPAPVLGDIVELSRLIANCREEVAGAATETSR